MATNSERTQTGNNASSSPSPTQVTGTTAGLANADAETWTGDTNTNTVSYANATEAVTADLRIPSDNRGTFAEGDTYSSIENLIGSQYDDILKGDSQDNRITGGEGDDEIGGGEGSDRLYGEAGSDRLSGGEGNDLLHGGGGADSLDGDAGADIILGGAGDDILEGGTGTDTYVFNANDGTDRLTDNGGNILFSGSVYAGATYDFAYVDGNVRLTVAKDGSTLNTIEFTNYPADYNFYTHIDGSQTSIPDTSLVLPLRLGSEENPFLASDAVDTFAGSANADWVSYAGSISGVRVALLTDPATAYFGWADSDRLTGINNLIGSDHDDALRGNSDDNIFLGGAGADTLVGEAGADILEGGEGEDIYIFGRGHGADIIRNDADGGRLYFRDVEDIGDFVFSRDENGDVVVSVGSDSDSVTILSSAYADGRYSIHYGADNTELGRLTIAAREGETRGTENNDFLAGTEGADILYGLEGDDTLIGGAGDDTLIGGAGDDRLDGGEGNDILYGDGGNGLATGQNDDDGIRGYNADIPGTSGDDTLYGGAGADTLYGGAGDDTLRGNNGEDTLYGGTGDDTLDGGRGLDTYVFESGDGADTLESDADSGRLYFRNAADSSDFVFSHVNRGAKITVGSDSVTIGPFAYVAGRYSIHYGADDTEWGKLSVGTDGDDGAVQGTASADVLVGFTGNDTLQGGAGDDTLYGGEGSDILEGGAGSDILEGGAGADTYVFDASGDTDIIVDDGGSIVFEQGTGNDYAGATYTFTHANAGSEAVTLTVTDSSGNTLSVIEFASDPSLDYTFYTLDSNGIETEIPAGLLVVPPRVVEFNEGSEGNPFLATAAADTFTGSEGADWVSYEGSTSWVGVKVNTDPATVYYGWAAGDTLTGINNIIGSDYNDNLYGNSGDNILRGGAGHDTLTGGGGADTLDGGDERDTASYEDSGKGVRVNLLLQGQAQIDFGGTHGFTANENEAVGDTLSDIEAVVGSDHNDWLTGDDKDNYLRGRAGDDRLEGGAGEDRLIGDAGNDTLYGGASNDILYGGAGDDELYGGAGNDLLNGGEGKDTLDGGEGIDIVSYGYLSYEGVRVDLSNTGEQEDFDGSHGFTANQGGDAVGDILSNIEEIYGSRYADWLTGDANDNILTGDFGDDRLEGGAGDDTLDGGYDWDILDGGAGDDRLEGGAGDDRLEGGAGNDRLYGGTGDDLLEGGAGSDTYVFFPFHSILYEDGHGTDTIVDDAGDTMTLRFEGNRHASYAAEDFTESSANFAKVGNNLEITIDKFSDNDITDKITILNAFDTDSSTGTGNAAFTINIEYGEYNSDTFTEVTNAFWHYLT